MDCWLEKHVHVHVWYLKVFLTYADQLAAYDAERKISLVINNVTVLMLFWCVLY